MVLLQAKGASDSKTTAGEKRLAKLLEQSDKLKQQLQMECIPVSDASRESSDQLLQQHQGCNAAVGMGQGNGDTMAGASSSWLPVPDNVISGHYLMSSGYNSVHDIFLAFHRLSYT
ncbi:hypothetical protein Unana1_01220 [Umbelopsis nana]